MAQETPKNTAQKIDILKILSHSAEETESFGEKLASLLTPGDVISLCGELGAGKTTLVRGINKGLGGDTSQVKSPTFVLMCEYPTSIPLIHIDGYRLEGTQSAQWLDSEELFSPHKITVAEWGERFSDMLPESTLVIEMQHVSSLKRQIKVIGGNSRSDLFISQLRKETKQSE